MRHKGQNKNWTPEEKLLLVSQVLTGKSIKSVAINEEINEGMLYQWVCKYKIGGYNGLIAQKRSRKLKNSEKRI